MAIAGPPARGKFTLAQALAARLDRLQPGLAAVVGMDGFHYDDALLTRRGILARKGAPFTFDVGGLAALLGRLRANAEDGIAVPVFDRGLEIARAGAEIIPRTTALVLVEGNYLLLEQNPWDGLWPLFDLTLLLDVPQDELRRRLVARWLGHGLDPDQALEKATGNDLPNAETVRRLSRAADIILTPG